MKEGLSYLLMGRVFSVLFSLFSIKVITSFLSPQEVGHYYLINAVIMWFALVFINPVGTYYNRHVHEWTEARVLRSSFLALNKYLLLAAFLVVPILALIKNIFPFAEYIDVWPFFVLVAFYTFFSTWFQTLGPTLNLLNKRKEFVLYTFLAQFTGLAFAISFIFFLSRDATNWFWGILAGQAIATILFWKVFNENFFESELKPQKFFTREMLAFSLPVMLSTLFMWVQTQGYRVVIESAAGAETLAFLGVGMGLAVSASGVVDSIATQYFHPDYFSELKQKDKKLRQNAWELLWKQLLGVYLPTMLFIAALAPLWLRILTAKPYHDAAIVLKWGVFVELARMLTNILYLVSHSEKKTKQSILPYFLGALGIATGLWFLIHFKSDALLSDVPIVVFASTLLCLIATYFFMRALMRFSVDIKFLLKQLVYLVPFIIWLALARRFDWTEYLLALVTLGLYLLFLLKKHLKVFS